MQAKAYIENHPLFKGVEPSSINWLAEIARVDQLDAGEFILRAGKPANNLFLIVNGRVSIELTPYDKGAIIIQTLADGHAVGWSWMLPPYTWNLDARTMEPTELVSIDASKLRERLNTDCKLAAVLYRRFAEVMLQRIHGMRKQLYQN